MLKKKRAHKTLHLALDEQLEAKLDVIVGWMEADPILGGIQAKLGREKAARYAIVRCIQNPPEHARRGR